jgi:hypothetical protein
VEIWQVLQQADEEAASRQSLAAQLRISTHTLQRILVRGDVPSFRGNENRRVLHSWARTLTRLARRFDRDPRTWITRVGIPWSEDVAKIVASIESPHARPRRGRKAPADLPGVVRIGIVDRSPLTLPLSEYDGSFLEVLARRWVGACDPDATIRVTPVEESAGIGALDEGGIDLLVGVAASSQRRKAGYRFVTVPGFRIPLGGLCIRPASDRASLDLAEIIARPRGTEIFLTIEDGIAHPFLAGACGISSERIIRRSPHTHADLLSALLRATDREPDRLVVLIAEEKTCRSVERLLQRAEGLPPGSAVRRLVDATGHVPSWPLAIATLADAEEWKDILEHARDVDLFDAAAETTARLYAAFARTFEIRPGPFDPVMPPFERALARHLPTVPGLPIKHCRSCSASLSEEHNIGASDAYCRWCSDESGHLRPRAEVERILARWIGNWQGGLTDDEALRRTRIFMQAMPAWSEN